MILIAPDKYRGTMTSAEAARIIAANIHGSSLVMPMADGGEGTAACIASLSPGWQMICQGCYYNPLLKIAALDSSAFVGYSRDILSMAPLERSTTPLGDFLNRIYEKFRPLNIYVGIGGTAVCDGGKGLLETLSPKVAWRNILIGLADVRTPLLPPCETGPSALSFCAQKGYTSEDIEKVKERLIRMVSKYGVATSPFAGAGGGIGYALCDVFGAQCFSGAEWLLKQARIPWSEIECAITGEGRYDSQTDMGKVVDAVHRAASEHGIPTICLAGSVEKQTRQIKDLKIIDLSQYLPDAPLTPEIAKQRLEHGARALAL